MYERKKEEARHLDWGKILWWMFGIFASVFAIGVLGFTMMVWILGSDLPDVKDFRNFISSQSTIIYDREGNILYTIHGDENREEVPLAQLPKHFIDATLAVEDDSFYSHAGFDIGGLIKAVVHEITGLGAQRGGSTITQQLVKNVFLSPERSYIRKAKELILAMRLEQAYTKDEILEMYLNRIPYGSNAYGIEMAAKTFFDKSAKDLTLLESAILASLPQAPSRLSPYGDNKQLLMGYTDEKGKYVPGRKDYVLDRMVETRAITRQQAEDAREESNRIVFRAYREKIKYPHFVFYVRDLLVKKFGEAAVEAGGLKVYTTIDPKLQDYAEKLIADRRDRYIKNYNATNAALFAVDATNGQILSMIGSSDYFDTEHDGNVNVVMRPRSPGSSFKPIVYATGFMKGYSPASVFMDVETDFGNNYKPQDYSGEESGPVSIRKALGGSLNIPAVKMAHFADVGAIIETAKKMGITSLSDDPDQYGISIGLGTGEVPLYEMVKAYSVFARGGTLIDFNPFIRIEDNKGNIIENFENLKIEEHEALDPQIAYSITNILSDPTSRPEGWDVLNLPGRPNGAKTGTSNKKMPDNSIRPGDLWTLGYTTRVVAGVWIGNNDNEHMSSGADGLNVAAPIWRAYMEFATKDQPVEHFDVPKGVVEMKVAKYSGKLPSELTPEDQIVTDVFTTYNTPTETDNVYSEIEVDGVTGKLPTEFTPASALVKKIILNFHSEYPENPDWEEPVQKWLKEHFTDPVYTIGMPEGTDDVHTAQTGSMAPSIQLVSPREGSSVSFGRVGLVPAIQSGRDIDRVEYFVNDKLVDTVKSAPFKGSYIFRNSDLTFGKVTVTAKVYDKLLYMGSDTIGIALGAKDTNPPSVTFIYPRNGSNVPAGSVMNASLDAFDSESDVKEVQFTLDGNVLGTATASPFAFTVMVPNSAGSHHLIASASDFSGNTAISEVSFEAISYEPRKGSIALIEPSNGSSFARGIPVIITGNLAIDMVDQIERIEFTAKKSDTRSGQNVGTITNMHGSRIFSLSWNPVSAGSYDITARAFLKNGESSLSGKIRVNIQP